MEANSSVMSHGLTSPVERLLTLDHHSCIRSKRFYERMIPLLEDQSNLMRHHRHGSDPIGVGLIRRICFDVRLFEHNAG